MTIRLGVPSKGRLMDKTFGWFAERGLDMRRSGSDREYAAEVAPPGAERGVDACFRPARSRASWRLGASISV